MFHGRPTSDNGTPDEGSFCIFKRAITPTRQAFQDSLQIHGIIDQFVHDVNNLVNVEAAQTVLDPFIEKNGLDKETFNLTKLREALDKVDASV